MEKKFQLKIVSAIAIEGKVCRPGAIVHVVEGLAKDLLRRGKAVPDDSEPAEAKAQREAAESEARAASEAAAAKDEAKTPAKGKAK